MFQSKVLSQVALSELCQLSDVLHFQSLCDGGSQFASEIATMRMNKAKATPSTGSTV